MNFTLTAIANMVEKMAFLGAGLASFFGLYQPQKSGFFEQLNQNDNKDRIFQILIYNFKPKARFLDTNRAFLRALTFYLFFHNHKKLFPILPYILPDNYL